MFEVSKEVNKKYVSCIKIDGCPILPPVMTPERVIEMQKYKKMAIELEALLSQKALEKIALTTVQPSIENPEPLYKKMATELEAQLCQEIGLLAVQSSTEYPASQLSEKALKNPAVELSIDYPETLDKLQVSQQVSLPAIQPSIEHLESQKTVIDNTEGKFDKSIKSIDQLNQFLDETNAKPKLIRQNSYILETPSPLLLAYIEENNKSESVCEKRRRSCWDLASAKEKWTSFENNLDIAFIPTKVNPKKVKSKFKRTCKSASLPPSQPPSPSPTPTKLNRPTSFTPKCSTPTGDTLNARDLYLAIQKEHSKQMVELMIRQKKEQETLLRKLKEQQVVFSQEMKLTYDPIVLQGVVDENMCSISVQTDNESSLQDKCLQTNNESDQPTPDCESISSQASDISELNNNNYVDSIEKSILIDDELNESTSINSCISSETITIERNSINQNCIITQMPNILIERLQSFRCSRELFPGIESIKTNNSKEHSVEEVEAAIIIQSHIRGYIVRRLLKTERVRNLIATVKDTLLCALEFHTEITDEIQQVDVDLHQRLIQQLTAACYAIHDTFFKLSIKEKMDIINLDRTRIQESQRRPRSARSAPLLSSTTTKVIQRKQLKSTSPQISSNNNVNGNLLNMSLVSSVPFDTKTYKIRRSSSQHSNRKPWL